MVAVALPRDRPRVTDKGVLCLQCFKRQPRSAFRTNQRTGEPHTLCGGVPGYAGCKAKYTGWSKRTPEQKLATFRPFESADAYSVGFVLLSHNRKLGPIPVSRTARGSCPESCSFKNAGCFAEVSYSRIHWEKVETTGLSWDAFCRRVAQLPKGQLWRHNEAGDLPGLGEAIDPIALSKLVIANKGRRGFTFTHKPVLETKPVSARSRSIPSHQERALWIVSNRRAIARAVRAGFAINLSADSLAQADELAALGIAPVSVVVAHDAPSHATKTPGGRQVVVCPNEAHGLTCDECQLCAAPDRKSIVAFRAHGQSKFLVERDRQGKENSVIDANEQTHEREPDRELGPELRAERWIVIGGHHLMWLHEPSRRSVTLEPDAPRKTERYDSMSIPCLHGEPADPTTEGNLVLCRVHDAVGNPISGTGFWIERYADALAYARSIRASILAETGAPAAERQVELFPVAGTERTPQPWARKILFVGYYGVVVTRARYEQIVRRAREREKTRREGDGPETWFERPLVLRLNEIVRCTGCDLVSSATLRHRLTLYAASRDLRLRGLEADLFDAARPPRLDEHGLRHEGELAPFAEWLEARTDVATFAIVTGEVFEGWDDQALAKIGHRVIRVDPKVGLSDEDVRRAISLLETPR